MKSKKHIFATLLVSALLIASTSCRTVIIPVHNRKVVHTNAHGKVPPGQMKKVTGEKSAKRYAPGQRKK